MASTKTAHTNRVRSLLRPKRLKTVAAFAVILALTDYYLSQGMEYLKAEQNIISLEDRLQQPAGATLVEDEELDQLKGQLSDEEARWQQLSLSYQAGSPGRLMELVAQAAEESSLELLWVRDGSTSQETVGTNRFEVHSINLQLTGEVGSLLDFLDYLRSQEQAISITTLVVTNLHDTAQIQMGLKFYLSPQLAPAEDDSTT